MPTTLHDREQAFEAKFAHDQEMQFMIRARRDKEFARWAAHELGMTQEQTNELINAVIHIKDGPGHEDAVLNAIAERLADHPGATRDVLHAALNRALADAHAALDNTANGVVEPKG